MQLAGQQRGAGVLHEHALLAGALAKILDAPIGVVADAGGLADHQIGRGKHRVQRPLPILQSAVVVRKMAKVDWLDDEPALAQEDKS